MPDEYRWETSLSHMTRTATKARSLATGEWISGHVRPEQRYRPPPGRGLRRKHPRHTRNSKPFLAATISSCRGVRR